MTLTYETAKKLKIAGFSTEFHGEGWSLNIDDDFPSLSELIDACGDEFGYLSHPHKGDWRVSDHDGNEFDGSTASEAVAALCLALQDKK